MNIHNEPTHCCGQETDKETLDPIILCQECKTKNVQWCWNSETGHKRHRPTWDEKQYKSGKPAIIRIRCENKDCWLWRFGMTRMIQDCTLLKPPSN